MSSGASSLWSSASSFSSASGGLRMSNSQWQSTASNSAISGSMVELMFRPWAKPCPINLKRSSPDLMPGACPKERTVIGTSIGTLPIRGMVACCRFLRRSRVLSPGRRRRSSSSTVMILPRSMATSGVMCLRSLARLVAFHAAQCRGQERPFCRCRAWSPSCHPRPLRLRLFRSPPCRHQPLPFPQAAGLLIHRVQIFRPHRTFLGPLQHFLV